MKYSEDIANEDGSVVVFAQGAYTSGWLRHSRDKVFWAVYSTLVDAQLGQNEIKSWTYDEDWDCFEEEVVEHWFETGESK